MTLTTPSVLPKTCPKCGGSYDHLDVFVRCEYVPAVPAIPARWWRKGTPGTPEHMKAVCLECHYTLIVPPLDAQAAPARRSTTDG